VKVIASSLRKGNIVDVDDKLYVIISVENIHPGKGTPVTQLDLRRLSDGVKISQRYKTTEQVEDLLFQRVGRFVGRRTSGIAVDEGLRASFSRRVRLAEVPPP